MSDCRDSNPYQTTKIIGGGRSFPFFEDEHKSHLGIAPVLNYEENKKSGDIILCIVVL